MQITFPPYQDLTTIIQTWVIYTNLEINNELFFQAVQCAPVKYPLKSSSKRMRVDPREVLEDGDIVFIEYNRQTKGTAFKPMSNREMRNCSTIIMKMKDRYHNVKISHGGSLQMTGIKSEEYACALISAIWNLLQKHKKIWSFQPSFTSFLGFMTCRMCNVIFSFANCRVDLKKLNHTVKMVVSRERPDAEFTSTFEPSIGYVGAKVKNNSTKQLIQDSEVVRITSNEDMTLRFEQSVFSDYLSALPRKIKSKKLGSDYRNSFLVFSTGTVIMSGKISKVNREDSYTKFCEMVRQYGAEFLKTDRAEISVVTTSEPEKK